MIDGAPGWIVTGEHCHLVPLRDLRRYCDDRDHRDDQQRKMERPRAQERAPCLSRGAYERALAHRRIHGAL